jgi:hypothetical protein
MQNEKKKDGTQILSQTVSQSERDRDRDKTSPSFFLKVYKTMMILLPKMATTIRIYTFLSSLFG